MMHLPLLLVDPGLHGDGDTDYYLRMLEAIQDWWPGWPPLGFKPQVWRETKSPWYKRVFAMHGRPPLGTPPGSGMARIAAACQHMGVHLVITVHDIEAVAEAAVYADAIKLGSFDATQPALVDTARATGLPLIASSGYGAKVKDALMLSCVSRYPAQAGWDNRFPGYSCHCTPFVAGRHIYTAAERGCECIEVHATMRAAKERPLPGDYCVSLPMDKLAMVAIDVGDLWAAPGSRL